MWRGEGLTRSPLPAVPRRMQSKDKTFVAPEGMWHIILKEPGNDKVRGRTAVVCGREGTGSRGQTQDHPTLRKGRTKLYRYGCREGKACSYRYAVGPN